MCRIWSKAAIPIWVIIIIIIIIIIILLNFLKSVMCFVWEVDSVWGQNSSVGIATRYKLDGQGIEFRWRARFSLPVQTDSAAHPAHSTMGSWSLSWG